MRRSHKKLRLPKETLAYLDGVQMRAAGGVPKMSEGRWLCPSSGTGWTDASVCPSNCASDCSLCYSAIPPCPI